MEEALEKLGRGVSTYLQGATSQAEWKVVSYNGAHHIQTCEIGASIPYTQGRNYMAGNTGGAGGAMAPPFFWSKIFFMNIIMANAFDSLVKAKKEKIFVWGRPKPKPF